MRPMSDVRSALVQALCAGAVGTFDVLAAHAGVPPQRAQTTLTHMRREGRVVIQGTRPIGMQRGRPRAVYAAPAPAPWACLDSVWR